MTYVGRFAPSPTGPLHLGSLIAAVASFVHARQAGGEWLVRIEDIDPPREVPGAAAEILRTLEAFDLSWDRSVVYQSQRLARYAETVETLLRAGRAFRCSCTRGSIQATHPASTRRYPGTCRERTHHARATAVRVRVDGGEQTFVDELQGRVSTRLERTTGDYVIWRRDGLPAYHLAVVLDDAAEGVTTVVRGIDLLESTAVHVHLQRLLDVGTPRYLHIPVVVNARGQKLSKQTGAEPIDRRAASETAWSALSLLGATMPADLRGERPATLWQWASDNWRIDRLRGCRAVCPAELGDAAKVD